MRRGPESSGASQGKSGERIANQGVAEQVSGRDPAESRIVKIPVT
jgi:hypothetical protein